MVTIVRLVRDRSGAGAAEFALVLPLLLILMFGIIDAGRYMWAVNQLEKSAQVGARYAVVTSPVVPAISTTDFVGVGGLSQGDRIPASFLPPITCTSSGCSGCPAYFSSCATDATAFNNIVARMQAFYPEITAANVTVQYRGSGIGFAGDPSNDTNWVNHAQIQPLVTIRLRGLTFQPITSLMLARVGMPTFATTLTAEDLSGTQST